jgi:hypothetical protein
VVSGKSGQCWEEKERRRARRSHASQIDTLHVRMSRSRRFSSRSLSDVVHDGYHSRIGGIFPWVQFPLSR